jgi:hypothetical protein
MPFVDHVEDGLQHPADLFGFVVGAVHHPRGQFHADVAPLQFLLAEQHRVAVAVELVFREGENDLLDAVFFGVFTKSGLRSF